MKLKDKPSQNVDDKRSISNRSPKSDAEQTGEHIFREMVFKDAIDKVSQQFDRSINPGKGDRQGYGTAKSVAAEMMKKKKAK